jgi:hypothetical protein
MKATHDAKGHDYEGGGRPYENLRAGEDWNIEAWKYAMLRADEKMRRLKSFAKNGTLKNEGVLDSLLDIAILAAIGYVLFDEATATATQPPQSRASACTPQSPCAGRQP